METRADPFVASSGLVCNRDLLALELGRPARRDLLLGTVEPAEHSTVLVEGLLHGAPRRADDHRTRAARMEPACRRRVDQVGRCARYGMKLGRVEGDRRAQELARVRVCRIGEDISGIAFLGDL